MVGRLSFWIAFVLGLLFGFEFCFLVAWLVLLYVLIGRLDLRIWFGRETSWVYWW